MNPNDKQRQRDRLRAEHPELVAVLSTIPRECIVAMAVYDADGSLIASTDRMPVYDPAEVWLPAERVIAMQAWGRGEAMAPAKMAPKGKGRKR